MSLCIWSCFYTGILSAKTNLQFFSLHCVSIDLHDMLLLQVYPVGTSSSNPGYMSLYYAVAQGVNDDKVKWPMLDRFIKMSVVDQGSVALTRMNQFSNYLTETGTTAWDKPTTVSYAAYLFATAYQLLMLCSNAYSTRMPKNVKRLSNVR